MFNKIYKDKKIIVTGNTGFKGSWLSLWLHSLGAKVQYFQRYSHEPSLFEELSLAGKSEHHFAISATAPG